MSTQDYMKFYIGGRRSGKTEMLVKWIRSNPDAIMIVHTVREAERIAAQYSLDLYRVRSIGEVEHGGLMGRRNVKLGIDNLNLILPNILGHHVERVTATGELI